MTRAEIEIFIAAKLGGLLGRIEAAGYENVQAHPVEEALAGLPVVLGVEIRAVKDGHPVNLPVMRADVSEEALLGALTTIAEASWLKRVSRS